MSNVPTMEMSQSIRDTKQKFLYLSRGFKIFGMRLQVAIHAKLHQEVNMLGVVENWVELNDVGLVQKWMDFYWIYELAYVIHWLLLNLFDRAKKACLLVPACVYVAQGSLSQQLSDLKILNRCLNDFLSDFFGLEIW